MNKGNKSAVTIRRKIQKLQGSGLSVKRKKKEASQSLKEWAFQSDEEPDIQTDKLLGPPTMQRLLMSEKKLFLGLITLRVINSLMIQTSFVPDEYWQSMEVAHKSTFGYGYLTWEWRVGLRGYSYPLVFSILYKLLEILHLDYRILLIKLPKILQAIFASIGDFYLYKFSRRISNQKIAQWTLSCQLLSWFTFYCCTRTLTNSVETSLTSMALYYFPWPYKSRRSQWKFVLLVGLAVIFRPTAAILWLPMCIWHFWLNRSWPLFKMVTKIYLFTGSFLHGASLIVDKHFYGDWVFVQWNFLKFNFISDLGTFYGSHPWYWYVTQGFPVIMFTHLVPFTLGAREVSNKILLYMIGWTILIYSLLGHKEFRFIFPIMPIAMHICGEYLAKLDTSLKDSSKHDNVNSTMFTSLHLFWRKIWTPYVAAMFLLITNIPIMLYTGLIHQRGTLDTMKYLANSAALLPGHTKMNILYLMPCHSTPYYSYLHTNVDMRFLTCEPDFTGLVNYADEADVFYKKPAKWLKRNINSSSLPTHIVLFDVLHGKITKFLTNHGYRECVRFFHTHFPEGRVGSYVVVFCR